jgi:hypothetical protein
MGASADLYASRMRGPNPDEGDEWIMRMALVMRGKRERHIRRYERIMDALRHGATADTMDEQEVFV